MRNKLLRALSMALVTSLLVPSCLFAQPKEKGWFSRQVESIELNAAYASTRKNYIGPKIPPLEYSQLNIRFGKKFKTKKFFPNANLERLVEISGSLAEEKNYITGVKIILRDYLKEKGIINPYLQIGTGIVNTDLYKNSEHEKTIGGPIEFRHEITVGTKIKIKKNLFLESEFSFEHISNGNIYRNGKNVGANMIKFGIGFTYPFW
jgi:hypothetical protein